MSTPRFPQARILSGLAVAFLTIAPVMAQTSAQSTVTTGTASSALVTSSSAPERVLERADLLPHLETIRRQYPRLYERLRREVPPEQLQQAAAVSATPAPSKIAGKAGSAAASTPDRATISRAVPIDALLRQDVRSRTARASSGIPAGGAQ